MRSPVENVLSFDLEHWYSATLLRDAVTDPTERIEESVEIVLDLLARRGVKATFFVVGEVARDHPELVAQIAADGHEIGSHGHTHRPLFELTREQFSHEIERSTAAIQDATGTMPVGFRAPNFSVTPRTQWAIAVLEASEYQYDSSVFPVRTPMYGVTGAPVRPYSIDPTAPFEDRPADHALVELPLAVFHPRFKLPVAGGFYARLLPTQLLQRGIRTLNARGLPATIYFHPWEFNPAVKTPSVTAHKRFVSFHGINRLKSKLETLLDTFTFTTAASVAREYANENDLVSYDTPSPVFQSEDSR
ncbi:polysaccharide deacetylase family protein [Halocatena marina]|uniref:polysaccharide deacetylase family protein n=1 Tax=Halocatena marina TaxID=2934937 RepID=UPI00200D300E|nr:polysaccharide deacetylase family protein [Halocatena marina]